MDFDRVRHLPLTTQVHSFGIAHAYSASYPNISRAVYSHLGSVTVYHLPS